MAISESHTLGEYLGLFFEDLMKKPFRDFAERNGLYFDCYGPRKARKGRKVSWTDIHGSKHDLDFVIEKNGTSEMIGEPVAFIELAWRRYTKHSKNKAQEISGAVNPICERYRFFHPFKGAVLSGQFTENALNQLRQEGFHVLYIPFERFVRVFAQRGFDIDFNEETSEVALRRKYMEISDPLRQKDLDQVRADLLEAFGGEIQQFMDELSASYHRKIRQISLLPLHGKEIEAEGVDEAIRLVSDYSELPAVHRLKYIEVLIRYNNESTIRCQFKEKQEVIDFLNRIR